VLVVSQPLSDPDEIVSLASHEWERLPLTAKLAVENPRALVLITLPKVVTTYTCHDCHHRLEWLVAAGVGANRIQVGVEPATAFSLVGPDRWWLLPYDRRYVKIRVWGDGVLFDSLGVLPFS
jgi:hypothetical protein